MSRTHTGLVHRVVSVSYYTPEETADSPPQTMLCRRNSTGSEPPAPGERCRCLLRNTFPGTEWLQNTIHLTTSPTPHMQIPPCQTLSLSSPPLPCSVCSPTPSHLSQPPPAPNPDGSEVFPQQTPSSRSSTMLLQHCPTLHTKKDKILSL